MLKPLLHMTIAPMLALALALVMPGSAALAQDNGKGTKSKSEAASTAGSEPDPIYSVRDSDAAMNAAIAEAQATLGEWLELYNNPPRGYSDFSLKYPLEGYEHIWTDIVSIRDGVVTARLANAPHAPGWSLGDTVRFRLSEVSDWSYFDDRGVAHGYRTVRVLFPIMPPEQVAQLKDAFGWEE